MSTLLLFIFIFIVYISNGNNEPIIGILTLPCYNDTSYCMSNPKATSYLPACYVKWLESGGARIIPIQSDDTFDNVNKLLPQLNGVLFTGGAADPSSFWYSQLQNILINLRKFATTKSESIPLWATCLGFEYMQCAIAGSTSLHQPHQSEDKALSINFTSIAKGSQIFNSTSMDNEYSTMIYNKLVTENLTMNFHKYGISPHEYKTYPYLNGNFSILGTNVDDNGTEFVSLIESKDDKISLNWYGSQFHPEKPQFVFDYHNGNNNIVHSLDAIMVSQYFTEFFVNQCKLRNSNIMNQKEYNEKVIYNYNPIFVYNGTKTYEQVYLFEKP